ncbi:WXG100 family type VII secretion target [Gordonia soli]|uniref:ESAT-6-like protein n=1 Tax=Gordonia soli NBRC 108243 TaxID=1223545 RepID=M0QC46_9ACTN|nr:WXG100 family type VII secretion target [Gordonia soli]GAC66203.1 hypothetical protein GS4_01_00040 [Gordonia soli NBRC 108243]
MADGTINYNFAGIQTLSGDLNNHFKRLGDLSDELKRTVEGLKGSWDSGASVSYQESQNNWDRVFMEAREQLLGLGKGVGNAGDLMRETDTRIGRMYSA